MRQRYQHSWLIRRGTRILFLFLVLVGLLGMKAVPLPASSTSLVYVVPVKETIEPGLVKFIERAYREAEKDGASWVVLMIDTPGGRVDAAMQIREQIRSARVPTAAYVTHQALSAGALITLACPRVMMNPGGIIGAAQPVVLLPGGQQPADEKLVSAWKEEMAATARINGRDPQIAAAMVDPDIEIPGIVEKGKLLTLSADRAWELGMIDQVAHSWDEVLQQLGVAGAQVVDFNLSPAEKLARWLTHPVVAPILLTIGIAGLIIELFTMGWGIAGTIGVISLALFFIGSMVAGLTGWETILLFAVGLVLLIIEILVIPGFGIAGIAGLVAMVISIFLASETPQQALITMSVALVGTVVLLILGFRFMGRRDLWSRLILRTRQENVEGYQAPSAQLEEYIGKVGVTLTHLRPAGTIEIENERVDVVTEGEYVPQGVAVKVVKIEGLRVVVRPEKEELE
ncbi:MAG: nodulation protein NfeD [Syntrophomonadaceae bacterium]|nr:nodulation protein NfeD [Syntrophomonadaceae bacterium]